MTTDPIALHACAAERIARTYEHRGDAVACEDIRVGNLDFDADEGMVLQSVGLDDGGAESRMLLAEHGDEGPAVVALACESVLRGYRRRIAERAQ